MRFILLLALLPACNQPRSSENHYKGAQGESYVCTIADGRVNLTSSLSPLPNCVKLNELEPDIATAAADAAVKGTPFIIPGPLAVKI